MSPFYNAVFLRGLAVTRIRINDSGVIVEAEGYDGNLRKWTYHYLDMFTVPVFVYE